MIQSNNMGQDALVPRARWRKEAELILYKSLADLKAEAARGYLGILWWFLEPVLYMLVFYVALTAIRHRSGDHIVPFLLCGLVSWKWFASSIGQGANSIAGSQGLIRQVYLPKYIFPCVSLLSNTIKFLTVFFILLLFLLVSGITPGWYWLTAPIILVIQLTLQLSLSSFLSVIVPFVPDIKPVIDNVMLLLFFVSGIMFDIERAPETVKPYLYANPMVTIISSYRRVLLENSSPNWLALCLILLASIAFLIIAFKLLNRYDRTFPKVMFK